MAAGQGTRMRSARPKVLHTLAGQPLLQHVLTTAALLQPRQLVVVVGHQGEQVQAHLTQHAPQARSVWQNPPQGTGHAVQQAVPELANDGVVLVLSGDVPLIDPPSLRALCAAAGTGSLALLTLQLSEPTGYGRIVRQGNAVVGIVEEKDATPAQRALTEVYTGVLAAPAAGLKRWLACLTNDNAQGEYYLTDVVAHAVAQGCAVHTVVAPHPSSVAGVNTPQQLAQLERAVQQQRAEALMTAGVQLADPARLDVRGSLQCGQDVRIDVNCVFEGDVVLGDGVHIGAHCVLRHAEVAPGAQLLPYTLVEGEAGQPVIIGPAARVGPYARLRPGTTLGADVHVGNFVEIKASTLGAGAKANHLAYVGDASVGQRVNVGAGTIVANYDGANKHRTTIEDDVHVGSNSVLVAPLTVGAGGTVGAGSAITKNTAPGALTVARAKPVSVPNWQRPTKPPKTPPK